MIFSEEQQRRLGELGAASEDLQAGFADSAERNRAFQRLESRLVTEQHERLDALCEGPRRPFILELENAFPPFCARRVSFRCILRSSCPAHASKKWAYSMVRSWKNRCSGSTPNAA